MSQVEVYRDGDIVEIIEYDQNLPTTDIESMLSRYFSPEYKILIVMPNQENSVTFRVTNYGLVRTLTIGNSPPVEDVLIDNDWCDLLGENRAYNVLMNLYFYFENGKWIREDNHALP